MIFGYDVPSIKGRDGFKWFRNCLDLFLVRLDSADPFTSTEFSPSFGRGDFFLLTYDPSPGPGITGLDGGFFIVEIFYS